LAESCRAASRRSEFIYIHTKDAALNDQEEMGPHHQHRLCGRLAGSPFKAAYVAAKHGMVWLTKVTALEQPRKA
jgi:NAD(P)-dependent dehydrogenase (short-subunit alcohol dehydrogenase family)